MNRRNVKVGAFISIPKCASKTTLEMFELGLERDLDHQTPRNHFIIYENHQRLCVLERRYNLQNHFIFTFVRNPYDRVKSWFFYHQNMAPYRGKTLNQWVTEGCPTHWTVQNMTNWRAEGKSPLLQYNFVESYKDNKVHYVGRMENFDEDVKKIIDILNRLFEGNGISKRIQYKPIRVNASKNSRQRDGKEELTEESRNKIYEMFKIDFEAFGYEKN